MIDFLSVFHQFPIQDRFAVAVLALVLSAFTGLAAAPLGGNANPFLWIVLDRTVGALGGRLDKRERTAADLMTRGMIVTVLGVVLAGVLGGLAALLAARLPVRGVTEAILLSLTLTGGVAWRTLLRLPLPKDGRKPWYALARSTRTDFAAADDFTVTRSAMAFAARSFDKGAVAPVFWYVIGGLPACYLFAGLAMLTWRFGRDGFGKGFGRTALALEMIMGFIPHIVAGILLALAGFFTPKGGLAVRPLAALVSGARRAVYAQGGLPVTALAYALNVTLGGPVHDLDGRALQRAWIGPDKATAQLEAAHMKRALYLVMVAYLLLVLALMACMLLAS